MPAPGELKGGEVDNTQFAAMMVALDNQATLLDNVVKTASNLSYQMDACIGVLLALIFAAAFRWHL